MTRAIRSVSIERGKDPRDFVLFAFGGNGGLFAAEMARELEIKRLVIPPSSGIFSAFGLLFSDVAHHFVQTMLGRSDSIEPSVVDRYWQSLEEEALTMLQREGYASEQTVLERSADLRYVGQSYELRVPWPDGASGSTNREVLAQLSRAFEAEHERTYGHGGVDQQTELVNLRLVARGLSSAPWFPENLQVVQQTWQSSKEPERQAYFGPEHGWLSARLLGRESLSHDPQPGPVIIEELDATLLIPPDFEVRIDSWRNVVMTPT